MCIFQYPIDTKIRHKCLKNSYPKDKFDKSTRRICLIYFSMAAFTDNIKFSLPNLNINNLMLINFHISLITKRFFCSFEPRSDKTANCCQTSINSVIKYWTFSESFKKVASKLFELLDAHLEYFNFLKKSPPENSFQFFFFNGSQN